jgi:hypothetical protein
MAKTSNKTTTPKSAEKSKPESKPKAPAKAKTSVSSTELLEQASEAALKKLQELGTYENLSSELEWCLGSYRFDRNPSGLYEVAGRTLAVLNAEKEKKTKGVTTKLVGDLEKALKSQ